MAEKGGQHVAVTRAENAALAEGLVRDEGDLYLPAAQIIDIDADILL